MLQEEVLVEAAVRHGIVASKDLKTVPEVLPPVVGGTKAMYSVLLDISNRRGAWNGALNHHACCYLFAKAVEAVIAWGGAAGARFSVLYEPGHLADMDPRPEVPPAAKQLVLDTRALGDKLFFAHQEWVKHQATLAGDGFDLDAEVFVLLKTVSELGMSHALERNYQALGCLQRP